MRMPVLTEGRQRRRGRGQKTAGTRAARKGRALLAAGILFLASMFFATVIPCHGAEHIVVYKVGEAAAPHWNQLKKFFTARGYRVSMYDAPNTMEKQIENVNRINRDKVSALLTMELVNGAAPQVFIAVSDAKKGKGRFLTMEEITAAHSENSRELATALASSLNTRFIHLPLFPLLGIDAAGVFLRIEYTTPESFNNTCTALHEGLQKYFGRSKKNES